MEFGPGLSCADQGRREDHGVEGDVVFAHELEKFNLFFILPPFLPLLSVVGSD